MARGGKSGEGSGEPERKCIATGDVQSKHGLIRFVVGPDGQIVADILGKLPGRGVWVSSDRAALEEAVKKNLFSKAARTKVTVLTRNPHKNTKRMALSLKLEHF